MIDIIMDKQEIEKTVEAYLADETKLYQDWYRSVSPIEDDPDTILFAESPSQESLKQRFRRWFDANKAELREGICVKWNYPEKRENFKDKKLLIIAILVDVLAGFLFLPSTNTMTMIVILVSDGYLDKLCKEES